MGIISFKYLFPFFCSIFRASTFFIFRFSKKLKRIWEACESIIALLHRFSSLHTYMPSDYLNKCMSMSENESVSKWVSKCQKMKRAMYRENVLNAELFAIHRMLTSTPPEICRQAGKQASKVFLYEFFFFSFSALFFFFFCCCNISL